MIAKAPLVSYRMCPGTFQCPVASRRSLFTIQKPLPPPKGYESWLHYAVENFDTRQPWLESMYETWVDETAVELDRDKIRESLRMEFMALKKAMKAMGSNS